MFYAESWALMHMLNLSPELSRPSAAVHHIAGQRHGRTGSIPHGVRPRFRARACRSAGVSQEDSQRPAGYPSAGAVCRRATPSRCRTWTRCCCAVMSLCAAGLADKARSLFEQAAREHPDSAAAQAGLGMLAMTQNRPGDARRYLERAIQLDDKDATILFEYALLERDAGAGNDRVRELLEKVVALNPNFGEAQLLLGVRATDDRSYDASHRVSARCRPSSAAAVLRVACAGVRAAEARPLSGSSGCRAARGSHGLDGRAGARGRSPPGRSARSGVREKRPLRAQARALV